MPWLHRKLFLKFLLFELITVTLSMGLWWLMPHYAWAIILASAILGMGGFFWLVSRPFEKVLHEFKALLTGKQYKRIYTKKIDEIGIIAHFFNQITHSLERVSTNIKEHKRLATELNVARKIQQDLIPKKAPNIPGLDIVAKTKSAAEIGGDAFDFIMKDTQSFMYIGDVTGHGVPSGLVMMIVDTLIHTFSDTCQDGHQLLVQTNKYLKPRIQTTMFMTMTMLRWEHQIQKMFYTGAGHETLFHFKSQEQICESIKAGGIALGMVPDNEKLIKEQSIDFQENDFIVLYTDGIVEARDENGEMYSIEKFKELVEHEAPNAHSAAELFQKLSGEVLGLLGNFIQEDDMTLMVIKKGPKPATEEVITSGEWENEPTSIDGEAEKMEESGLNA